MDEADWAKAFEFGIDSAASLLLGAAAAFFTWATGAPGLAVGAAGTLASASAAGLLWRIGCRQPVFPLAFEPAALEIAAEDHLDVLELDEVLEQPAPAEETRSDELLLDDILESLAPDSRVVRLFDPKAMPTAGQLKANIDLHLKAGRRPPPQKDASDALYEALADLKRSLR